MHGVITRSGTALDFYLPHEDVYIKCKEKYTPYITQQTASVDNIIVVQGEAAAHWFAQKILGEK